MYKSSSNSDAIVAENGSFLLDRVLDSDILRRSDEAVEAGLYPFFRSLSKVGESRSVMNDGREVVMFGSNSYLGLSSHPKVIQAGADAIRKYGSGCCGSRFLNGTIDLHLEFEEKIAKFLNVEKAIIFSTGFQVNLGCIPALVGRNDFIIIDERVHACIIEGTRLALGKVLKFKHNDMNSLEERLKTCTPSAIKLIVVDGVYSMEGDIANIPVISTLAKKYGADIYIDDAHGVGVLAEGRGTAAHYGMTNDVSLIMSTFSKSFATTGGFVAGRAPVIDYLKHVSRTFLFSASLTPSCTASAMAALELIQEDKSIFRRLWSNTKYLSELMRSRGMDIGHSQTPIIPFMVRDEKKTFLFTKFLYEDENVFVNPVISPGVPPEESLLRLSVTAAHTQEDLDYLVGALERVSSKVNRLHS